MKDELDAWRQAKDEFMGALRLAKRYRGRLQQLVKELDPDQQAALQAEWDSEKLSPQEQEVLQWLE
jgi:hypothetical protein